MSTVSKPKTPRRKATGLTSTEEKILRVFGELLPFATAKDITRLLYKKGSLSYVRNIMTRLAGGADYRNHYLYRFGMPNAPGNFERIYTLGRRGRDFLRELGVEATFWYRPQKASPYSFSFLLHHLSVVKFLVALHAFVRAYPAYQLVETRTWYEMTRNPPRITLGSGGQETTVSVIPDAWVYLEHANGRGTALWIEVDTGTEAKSKFQHLVRDRLALIRSGQYAAYFALPSVLLCYVTIGSTRAYRFARLHTIRRWSAAVLAEEQLDDWASVFRFATIEETLYDSHLLFLERVWFRPDAETTVSLFT